MYGVVERGGDVDEELKEVVIDDAGRAGTLTKKESMPTGNGWIPAYSKVNTWESSRRSGDWKSTWLRRGPPIRILGRETVTATGESPSIL